ncbi:MAG TPA: Ig-like domain-containing protein, partial [Gemmatimonadaceae bacterium]
MKIARIRFAALGLLLFAACKDKSPTVPKGTPKIVEVSPVTRSGPANTVVAPDVVVKVLDADGKPVSGQTVFFSIVGGDGSLTGNASVTTDANGQATAPTWKLGKSANGPSGQVLRAISGSLDPLDVPATINTNYNIVVRFFGSTTMSASQQAIFQNAARRIAGVITGDIPDVQLTNTDMSNCASGVAPLNEVADDLIIYAESKPNDGVGGILGSSHPCYARIAGPGCASGCVNIPVIGSMSFDSADLNALEANGTLQDVITHEMLHVVGVGTMWDNASLITGEGTSDPRYVGAQGISGCQAVGGTVTCASYVPLAGQGCPPASGQECNTGTRDAHWQEGPFGNELMTGFLNNGSNPMSMLTVRSLA